MPKQPERLEDLDTLARSIAQKVQRDMATVDALTPYQIGKTIKDLQSLRRRTVRYLSESGQSSEFPTPARLKR